MVEAGGVAVHGAFVTVPAGGTAALYLRAVDVDGEGDRLLGAGCGEARQVMLHRTLHEGGRVSMAPVENGIAVAAGGEARLAPGGDHVMLMGLERALSPGDLLEVELRFERAGALSLRVPVVAWEDVEALTAPDHGGHH